MANTDGLKTKYFVLKPNGTDPYAIASRAAITAYAESIHTLPLTCNTGIGALICSVAGIMASSMSR